MKRAIFFDVDGTLLDCLNGISDITPRVKKSIRELQANGDYVFIATGRPYAFMSEALLNFGFDGFVLTNGSQVTIKDKLIYNDPINKDFVKELVNNFERLSLQYILQGKLHSYMKENCRELYSFFDSCSISRKYIESVYDIENVDTYKIEMLCKNKKDVSYCLSLANSNYDCIQDLERDHFEFYSKRNTKATGILKALDYLNIDIENSYAFGDGTNDIEMLSTVGCGIAMGNASDEVKSYAKKVTDTVHNDGVALGIEAFII
ncbi:HAD family hydrolase [Clostridium vincentii]|uniref:Putative phosphatase n=1 Tax=Clostridium vincentii TaxID=52704 RepID=A0A2T0BEB1_9CLOT|nr:HAD family hydrolase [Clostridium vincentii]PRR82162.1 putative phosphatase [Clostridium vincentii]